MADDQEPQEPQDPGEELAHLVGALRTHLRWRIGDGQAYIQAGPSPRSGIAADVAPEGVDGLDGAPEPPAEVSLEPGAPDAEPGPAPDPEVAGVLLDPGSGADGLRRVREALGDCQRCRLATTRIQLVFGQGNPEADLMFVGEAPGRDEDLAGEAFVGTAGALLTKMIQAMGLDRDKVFIGNVIKCRPPRNRNPEDDEIDRCQPFLAAQIRAIQPAIIITLGRFAAQTLLQTGQGITRLRGQLHTFRIDDREIPVMPTFHPAYLLRKAEAKRPVWDDLQQVMGWMKERGLLT